MVKKEPKRVSYLPDEREKELYYNKKWSEENDIDESNVKTLWGLNYLKSIFDEIVDRILSAIKGPELVRVMGINCPKCGSNYIMSEKKQLRAADEETDVKMKCGTCKNTKFSNQG